MKRLRTVSVLKEFYRHTSGRTRDYSQLSPPFFVPSGVRQERPILPFLFNFVIDNVLQDALFSILDGGVEILLGNRDFELTYADDITLLSDDAQVIQRVLDRLAIEVSRYGMCFVPSNCKVLVQERQEPAPTLTL